MTILEITYRLRRITPNHVAVMKAVDDEPSNVVYNVTGPSNCDCPGCVYHHTSCKHLNMFKIWEERGEPEVLFFFRDGRLWIRHIEDPNAGLWG